MPGGMPLSLAGRRPRKVANAQRWCFWNVADDCN